MCLWINKAEDFAERDAGCGVARRGTTREHVCLAAFYQSPLTSIESAFHERCHVSRAASSSQKVVAERGCCPKVKDVIWRVETLLNSGTKNGWNLFQWTGAIETGTPRKPITSLVSNKSCHIWWKIYIFPIRLNKKCVYFFVYEILSHS